MTSSFDYPPYRRVRLTAVKEQLYHPRLPSLRRMDMDDVGHKLPEAHSRTTTSCGPRDFANATSTTLEPESGDRLASLHIIKDADDLMSRAADEVDDVTMRPGWTRSLTTLGEIPAAIPRPDPKDFRFSNYAVRHLKDDVTRSWKMKLTHEPKLDEVGQRPIPTNIFTRGMQYHVIDPWR